MGDTNKIDLGDGASAKQVAAGHHNTQTIIEQQNNYYAARPQGARFSLPPPPRDFTGRAQEVETLVGQLTHGGAALVGIVGMGGIGKSALAQVVAARVSPHFPDGQLWVDLLGKSEVPTASLDAMRQVILALDPTADLSKAGDATVAQLYRGVLQGKRVLIVLDNAADNVQLRPLLQADAVFLVTARTMLTEAGLRPLRLDVMQEADARAYLLAQGARLTAEEADALAELCGYLPLALKVAASYLVARPNIKFALYLEQLRERRLELLRERNDPELNVEAAFSITYNQLTPDLQLLWRMLGVFPAPFGTSSAQFVWGIENVGQAEAALGELLRESLIEYDTEGEDYRLHDLLGEFARRRLVQTERAKAEKRHAEFYLSVARTVDELYLQGGENIMCGMWLFEQEQTHLRAGQRWSATHLETDEDAASMCSQYPFVVAHVMNLRMNASERTLWLEDAVRAARKLGDRKAEADALGNLGNAYLALNNLRHASDYYEQALTIDREVGDGFGQANSLGNLGLVYLRLGELDLALDYQNRDVSMRRDLRDRRGEGTALGNLGKTYLARGNTIEAKTGFEQQLEIALETGDRHGEVNARNNLGNVYAEQKDFRKAAEFSNGALQIAHEIEYKQGAVEAYGNLGMVFLTVSQFGKAIDLYTQQLNLAREIGDRNAEANALMNLGQASKYLNDVPRTLELWTQALDIYVRMGSPMAEQVKVWLQDPDKGN